ncbi:Exodeoxyribonuclease VII large subunit [Faunimonas pinastri]|uniref:Exodeoxyribonuclease 7 large subunit n=2 Tax=Faunimonas pinastri TaxID=1855383 RepID=A0A1H8ZJT1_9HYPH|nr:Exodeoxyribonuclease VII large subunit [Faunimonas pinastri]
MDLNGERAGVKTARMSQQVAPATNVAEFTVSELSFALKRTVEENFEHVRVRGEISGFRGTVGSGHAYFTLKDDKACIDAVVWKTTFTRLRFKPQEGLEVIAVGKLTTFPGRSKYQIVIESLEPAGEGALMALLEERRRKLQAEGLFDESRKRPIPYLPSVIGVVTSPTGAVIRDILHRLRDRFPSRVLVWPVRVQGEGAADEVANAVRGFNAIDGSGALPRPDLLIVARGGGSIEDLWAFNEEVAIRAVAESRIPTIAAVGHETDWTLIDFAADLRAPTPTGAAEKAVPVRSELLAVTGDLASRHEAVFWRCMEARRRELLALSRAMPSLSGLLAMPRQRLDHVGSRLGRALGSEVALKRRSADAVTARLSPMLLTRSAAQGRERVEAVHRRLVAAHAARLRQERRDLDRTGARLQIGCVGRIVRRQRERFEQASRLLQSYGQLFSEEAMLARGFALVTDADGGRIGSAADLRLGDSIAIRFADGAVAASITGESSEPPALSASPKPRAQKLPKPTKARVPVPGSRQGSLF